jgi:hypothetical protein
MSSQTIEIRALERYYQYLRRLEAEDLANEDLDAPCDRAERRTRALKHSNQLRLAWHVRDRHGRDALEEFSFWMEAMAGMAVMLEVSLMAA